ncbi:MAG: DUF7088 domain-containing protein [Phycisphaerales bacterium]
MAVGRLRRFGLWINLAIYLASVIVIVASIVIILHRPALRAQIDATKTRAYSLSSQTQTMLRSLEGEWKISMVLIKDNVDRAAMRQLDEVLRRYDDAGGSQLSVERIDPTDPASLAAYEALIERLRSSDGEAIAEYEFHLAAARRRYAELIATAERENQQLAAALSDVPQGEVMHTNLAGVARNISLLAINGPKVIEYIDTSLAVSDDRILPDYEAARDVLAEALHTAALDFQTMADLYENWAKGENLTAQLRAYLASARLRFSETAKQSQSTVEPLIHTLEPLSITNIAKQLGEGEAAIISGPRGARVIPARQLLPRSNLRATQSGGITFDQRFRGEQLLSSTIQAMLIDPMPMVIFVHDRPQSLLRQSQDHVDLFGAGTLLMAAGYDVREWQVSEVEQPRAKDGQTRVWIVVPSPPGSAAGRQQRAFETTREERTLIERMSRLIADGEQVCINFYPSLLHALRQPDPWQRHLEPLGLEARTERVLFQSGLGEGGTSVRAPVADFISLHADHLISSAVSGQLLQLPIPVEIELLEGEHADGIERAVIVEQPVNERYSLEPDWMQAMQDARGRTPDNDAVALEHPIALAAAVSRRHPLDQGKRQRIVAIGSAGWLQTNLADRVINLGGDRRALAYPGNYELLQATVAWLSGNDELIARSAATQQVARLDGITPQVRTRWQWITLAGLPLGCLVFGGIVWLLRRV